MRASLTRVIPASARITAVWGLVLLAVACSHSPPASTSPAVEPAGQVGRDAPTWLRRAARRSAVELSDRSRPVTVEYIAPNSRFPRIVLTGSFVCDACSRPFGGHSPTGTAAVARYDGKTRQSLDFGLCAERAQCERSLCNGRRCTRTSLLFDAGLRALQEGLAEFAAGGELGTYRCHMPFSRGDTRYVIASCKMTLKVRSPHAAVLQLTRSWNREYRRGLYVEVPRRTHTWRVIVTKDGWRTRVTSSGDPLPQLVR